MTVFLDIMVLFFTACLFINYGILVLSMVRLINFLAEKKRTLIKVMGYLVLVPFSLLYLNQNFLMMAFYWGVTSFDLSWCLYSPICLSKNEYNSDSYFNVIEYFQQDENGTIFKMIKTSHDISLFTPLIFTLLFYF